jgi:hypothetical protein
MNPKAKIVIAVVAGALAVVLPPAVLWAFGVPFMVVALVACVLGASAGVAVAKRFLDGPAQP